MENIYQISDYQNGYYQGKNHFHCLYCKQTYEKECVYPSGDQFFTAKKAMETHLETKHQGSLRPLLDLPKETSGLSEIQQDLLALFAQGISDKMIAQRLGITTSTVRNHRFKLKEKEKQARILIAAMSLLTDSDNVLPHAGATMLDERYDISPDERQKVLANFINENGFISTFPAKEKRKIILLTAIVTDFDPSKNYSEAAVNEMLKRRIDDYATVRRYLIEYGFMKRTKDGQSYWRV